MPGLCLTTVLRSHKEFKLGSNVQVIHSKLVDSSPMGDRNFQNSLRSILMIILGLICASLGEDEAEHQTVSLYCWYQVFWVVLTRKAFGRC